MYFGLGLMLVNAGEVPEPLSRALRDAHAISVMVAQPRVHVPLSLASCKV